MSNEELVAEIQAGAADRIGELWEQIERLVTWKADRIITALNPCRGVEFDDLYQSGYLALVNAVQTYDPAAGASFATWFMPYLKTAFAEATGYRTQKGRKEPLNNSLSLDTPLTDDADSDELMDVIADPSGQAGLESAEEIIYQEQLHNAMENALSAIPEQYADVLRLRYYDGLTLENAGEVQGIGKERVRAMENKALRLLRRPKTACCLRPFYDFDFYRSTGLCAFRYDGMSVQERYLVVEEERKEREARRHRKKQENDIQNQIKTMFENINQEAEATVAAMTPEGKRALLEKYGYAET